MSNIKISNFADTVIALGITATDTEFHVADASVFPSISGEQYFYCVLEDASLNREIVKVTNKASNILTVIRGQEGTLARAWNVNDSISLRLTAGTIENRFLETETAVDARIDAAETLLNQVATRIKIGEVITWATEVLPTSFLECDGSAISRSSYSSLYNILGTRYGVGDGLTTFNLPDYRGQFLRGVSGTSGKDPDASSRLNRGDGTTGNVIGTKQTSQNLAHSHSLDVGGQWIAEGGAWAYGDREHGEALNTTIVQTNGGAEARPTNVNVIFCIRYE